MFIGRAVRFFSFSLEYCRDVSGEYREENHTRGGENDGKDLPIFVTPKIFDPTVVTFISAQSKASQYGFHGRVNTVFHVVENDAAKIDRREKNRQVRGKQIGDPAACHPTHDE